MADCGKSLFVDNRPFLDAPNNVGLALNIDWFNPFEHTQYSIGAIIIFNYLELTQRREI